MSPLFAAQPLVIAALHLPDFSELWADRSMAWLEDYTLQNLSIFADSGVPAVILQDMTPYTGRAHPESIAVMASLGRLAREAHPELELGIILQAHDGVAPLAVAHACGASFVRIKVFVGAMVKSEGVLQGVGIDARAYRQHLQGAEPVILADVHDRTGYPLADVQIDVAAHWASRTGADGLILTGFTYDESLEYLRRVREHGVKRPLILGGGATEGNISEVLRVADGVIVSSALMRDDAAPEEMLRWDQDKVERFMEAAHRTA